MATEHGTYPERFIETRRLPTVVGDKAYVDGIEIPRYSHRVERMGIWYRVNIW